MPQWEYRKINVNDLPRRLEDIDVLTDAGEQGWELIAIAPNNIAYLKRSIGGSAPAPTATHATRPRRQPALSDRHISLPQNEDRPRQQPSPSYGCGRRQHSKSVDHIFGLPATAEADIPRLLDGYDTCINDATYFTEVTLKRCSNLRHMVFLGAGAASFVDLAAAERAGIKVSTIKGYGDTTVAEHAMGLVFAAARHIATMHKIVREGGWGAMQGMELKGKMLGLIGLGGIGREMARLGKGIGMKVIAFNRSVVTDVPVPLVPIDDLLARSDIVSLHLALNDATRHFLDRTRLEKLKPGAIVINTARAGIVDEAALVDLLRSGHVGHYATDVFSQEPPNLSEPLLRLDRVTLTAHSGYNTPEAAKTMYRRAIDLAAAGW